MRLEATRQARQSPLFFDLTLSLSKSISIFHASLGDNSRLARQAEDAAGEEYYRFAVAWHKVTVWMTIIVRGGIRLRDAVCHGRPREQR